jgi:hypothetical protein
MTACRRVVALALIAAPAPASAQTPKEQVPPQAPFGERWQSVSAKPQAPAAEKLPVSVEQAFY